MRELHDLVYEAMLFACDVHAGQVRKYTNNPYSDHLAEVVGIVASVDPSPVTLAVAWLHDCVEDCNVSLDDLRQEFGVTVAAGVFLLTDNKDGGNRATRKALDRGRLACAPQWVQTIKVADLISNTSSIVKHDPQFAKVYLAEKRELLDVLVLADRRLVTLARD